MPDPTLTDLRTARAIIEQRRRELLSSPTATPQQLRDLELAADHFRHRINKMQLGEALQHLKGRKS